MRDSFYKRAVFVIFLIAFVFAYPIEKGVSDEKHHTPPSQQRFDNIDLWTKIFEDPARDKWQMPDEVIKNLNLKPGDVVADLGAGTGYFTRRLAVAVGPQGKAIGIEVEPNMVKYMEEDAKKLNLKNYTARLVKYDDAGLEPNSVDVIFICDTYHHLEDRTNYFRKAARSLKPKGRVVVVDFYKKQLPVGPQDLEHKLSEVMVIKEMWEAGYRLKRFLDFLPYQYFIEFEL
ncbi:MAG: class I SAM-dependent methyltransferase [Nitrospirae bacterium]|nr:class I SAM-dependent methyltransferase [Nitrospirota bacterium]